MTIAQVSRKYEISTDTLRYYERIGLLPKINRTASGIRDYSDSDGDWISYIKCMRSAGISIETLVEYVRLYRLGPSTIGQRKELLLQQRKEIVSRIETMNETLARLDWKIDGYEERMLKYEQEHLH
jgi:DNA-binding transcriptional MerR regulator